MMTVEPFPVVSAPDVSVIVPVYNNESHLEACLRSILDQSLRAIEVICVDDGSNDGSSAILGEHARCDGRVTVVRHDRNRGAAEARNLGLARASGEFVQFTDADDVLPTDALEGLLAKARRDGVDVVRGGIVGFHSGQPDDGEVLFLPGDASRFRPLESPSYWVPWWHVTYLFGRRFLLDEGLRYPDLSSGEDPVFLAQVLSRVEAMSSVAAVTYRYRLRPLRDKGRATYRHLHDYLRHVEMVRDVFLSVRPDAWHRGFAPVLLPEIRRMVYEWPMSAAERRAARAEAHRIFGVQAAPAERPPTRLLFLYNVCGLGGVETTIINKQKALQPLGIEVRALFQDQWGEGAVMAGQPGFVIEGSTEAQRRYIRSWSPHAIVVVDSPWLIDVVGGAGVAAPILFETHTSSPEALARRVVPGASDPRVAAVIAPSRFNAAMLAARGVDRERLRLIPNAVDLDRFRSGLQSDILARLGVLDRRRVLLFVGRLEPEKNPSEFVRIVTELARRSPDIHGVVIGDAVDTEPFAAASREEAHATPGRFTFVPRVRHDEMPQLYNATAASGGCLLSTSLHESQPMVLLEAMACGLPVVASDVGGNHEIVENGRTGCLYPLGDAAQAVAEAERLLDDTAFRATVVRAAEDSVRRGHALAHAAQAYAALLQDVGVRVELARGSSVSGADRLAHRLVGLFTEKLLVGVRRTVTAYEDLAPGVHLGFETTAAVQLEMRPKTDFSRSPDACLNTLVLDYRGPSRWLTIESAVPWAEVAGARQFQVEIHGRARRSLGCRVVLRLPKNDEAFEDATLCDLTLGPDGRPAHGRGSLPIAPPVPRPDGTEPKLLFFFAAAADIHLELDFLNAYFG
jgi:glycosyltransferase involved in cell wall biosynthesis